MVVNDVEYYLNDPISYWDWYLLSKSEKGLFVDETYVSIAECTIGETAYPAGTVLLPDEYEAKKTTTVHHVEKNQDVPFTDVFRPSNNLGHDTGYILTYKVNNPTEWDTWYTQVSSATHEKRSTTQYTGQDGYEDGPTYYLTSNTAKVLGQREYNKSNIISKSVYDTYDAIVRNHPSALPGDQATFKPAYIVTEELTTTLNDEQHTQQHLNPGVPVAMENYTDATWSSMSGSVAPAYICTSTIQLSKSELILMNTLMTEDEKTTYYNQFKDGTSAEKQIANDIDKLIVPAYYCTSPGLYGGDYYESGKNYRGLAAWCSMSEQDRTNFTFNYDALDLLIDPTYGRNEGEKYQYDGNGFTSEEQARTNAAGYSVTQPLDYTATYISTTNLTLLNDVIVKRGNTSTSTNSIQKDDELSREVYEAIPNEQRYYAPIKVQNIGTYYVVKEPLQIGNTPYAVGATITTEVYNKLSDSDKSRVVGISFNDDSDRNKTFYFCRESYTVNHLGKGQPVKAVKAVEGVAAVGDTKANGQSVPVGFVISQDGVDAKYQYGYKSLVNEQKDFTIHGIAPTETSTLFVSRNSDIFDLSTEKIITVIYQYDYEEGDAAGNVTPLSERHVVNIHVKFKSGVPTVEDIREPQIVLPGDVVGMREPNVTPGAYEVTGGGWELFEKKSDVESHTNGVEFAPGFDPLYWYQDGYYLAYYAKTYLGKTYSNEVQVSVANYHDLKKVMDDKDHHYYIDKPDIQRLKRYPKVYINDGTDGLNQLKNFFDLSLLTSTSPGVTDGKVTAEGVLKDHALLDAQVKGAQDIDFILRRNITHTGVWTPIGKNTAECFGGNLHGDGYYIEGLDHSLFESLCGDVYNLGVMGSFTEAGIANTGTGYVENCWVKSSATSGFPANTRAVFGKPTADSGIKQIVNCYYSVGNDYTVTSDDGQHGIARQMPADDFHNGTVAYNLNGFYLYKRYCDHEVTDGIPYKYYTINAENNTLSDPKSDKLYASNGSICSTGVNGGKYVEDRFADGDFQYANGSIPSVVNERKYVDNEGNAFYYPIWPDDYIYFGQMLTYGWNELRPHEEVPSHIYKSNDRLVKNDQSNRVYRAPAYYGSKTMSVAHFNPSVNLVAYSKQQNDQDIDLHPAYPSMTAIDFYGWNDGAYKLGLNDNYFYQPLLDDDGIESIINRNETRNLLVYAPSAEVNAETYTMLTEYFTEPSCVESTEGYRRIAKANTSDVSGHLVLSSKVAASDHLLVDEEIFNCPISYNMGGYRMWYQRLPKNYVTLESAGKTKGWEDVCLPFVAELVTTPDKGEITHFYKDDLHNKGDQGHEYWLREFDNVGTPSGDELPANFVYPSNGTYTKDNNNTFLWDYYYSKNASKDANEDIYQTDYYSSDYLDAWYSNVTNYPLFQSATPYLVGFPGKTYYEFDLSGQFEVQNTYNNSNIDKLPAQTIIFASKKKVGNEDPVTIGVSDDELSHVSDDELPYGQVTKGNYTFYPNYSDHALEANVSYLLNGDGNKYVVQNAATKAKPFHPYFVKTGTSGNGSRGAENTDNAIINSIIFSNEPTTPHTTKLQPVDKSENLLMKAGRKKIVVESQLHKDAEVRIVTPAGITLNAYIIEPGETVETRVENGGVYIVYAAGGQYVKKLIVK